MAMAMARYKYGFPKMDNQRLVLDPIVTSIKRLKRRTTSKTIL